VAPAGALVSFILMLGLPLDTWIRLAVWLAIGLAIYVFYGRHHSKASRHRQNKHEPRETATALADAVTVESR
jgi:hypothetical protein